MNPHRAASLTLLLILLSVPVLPQTNKQTASPTMGPDLSGQWIMDRSRSNLEKEIHDYSLTIVQRDDEIRFAKIYWRGKRQVKEDVTYHTNGRSEFSSAGFGARAETRWQGRKLVRKTVWNPPNSPVGYEFLTLEEWSISPDNQTLIRSISNTGPGISMSSKTVFVRRP